jgi:hypothetical protein
MKSAILLLVLCFFQVANAEDLCDVHEDNGYLQLRELTQVTSTYTGAAGIKPDHVVAYECLMISENREKILNELVTESAIGGQLYALAGLRALGSSTFQREITRFESSNETISATIGCAVRRQTVGEVTRWIQEDEWPTYREPGAQ